jgi:hypothetical protein
MPSKVGRMMEEGPALLSMPGDSQIGVYEQFTHPDQDYGWIRDRIKIFEQEGAGGGEPVSLSINGFKIEIPRGIECDVARPFIENLRHAVETRQEQNDRGETTFREVPRYHWSMIQEAVNLQAVKAKMKADIERQNQKIIKEWDESKNGDVT